MRTKAHIRYKNAEGKIVPSVTTILGVLDKPALLNWAWQCGMDGEDYRKVRDTAADSGTLAHYLVECEIKGTTPDLSEYSQVDIGRAETGYLAWLDWEKHQQLETIASEIALVSEAHGFGGTIDRIARSSEGIWLTDFKTSKAIYAEHIYQVASYKALWEEVHPDMPISRVHILRLDKTDGSFEDYLIPQVKLEVGWQIFLHCLAIYTMRKEIGT